MYSVFQIDAKKNDIIQEFMKLSSDEIYFCESEKYKLGVKGDYIRLGYGSKDIENICSNYIAFKPEDIILVNLENNETRSDEIKIKEIKTKLSNKDYLILSKDKLEWFKSDVCSNNNLVIITNCVPNIIDTYLSKLSQLINIIDTINNNLNYFNEDEYLIESYENSHKELEDKLEKCLKNKVCIICSLKNNI